MSEQVNKADRTFETRVQFIHDIFANKFPPETILASSIQYKLGNSLDNYMYEVSQSYWSLNGQDPIKVLKKLDSDN